MKLLFTKINAVNKVEYSAHQVMRSGESLLQFLGSFATGLFRAKQSAGDSVKLVSAILVY